MYNTSNPAELYAETTWELLPDNKFLKTGSTPLQQSGSNSIKLTKANLPTDKLQVESHSMTRGSMNITGSVKGTGEAAAFESPSGAFTGSTTSAPIISWTSNYPGLVRYLTLDASRSWTGSTSSASPYTTAMGSGTPLTINPEHITVKAWKRLT